MARTQPEFDITVVGAGYGGPHPAGGHRRQGDGRAGAVDREHEGAARVHRAGNGSGPRTHREGFVAVSPELLDQPEYLLLDTPWDIKGIRRDHSDPQASPLCRLR